MKSNVNFKPTGKFEGVIAMGEHGERLLKFPFVLENGTRQYRYYAHNSSDDVLRHRTTGWYDSADEAAQAFCKGKFL